MRCLSIVVLLGLVAVSLCASEYDPSYQPQPMGRPGRRPRPSRPSMTYNPAQEKLNRPFDAEEVQRIIGNAIPGKDYPIFSLDNLPQTSFKCDGPNIHYPGYYADVETGCQVFHFCPPKLENYEPTYQQPSQGYRPPQEPEYRRKRATYSSGYGQQQQPDTYYGHDEEEQYPVQSQPSYQSQPQTSYQSQPMPTYHAKPQEKPVPQRPRYENPISYPSQTYEQEEKLISYLCPNQTIFDQTRLICDWFYNVICEHAVQNYDLANSRLYQENAPLLDEVPEIEHPSNLNLNPLPQQEMPQQQQKQYRPRRPMRPMPQQAPQPDSYEEQPY